MYLNLFFKAYYFFHIKESKKNEFFVLFSKKNNQKKLSYKDRQSSSKSFLVFIPSNQATKKDIGA